MSSDIDFMPEPEELLKVGDRVQEVSSAKLKRTGTIIPAGPYGDQPFQVKLDSGNHYVDGVYSDGTVHQSDMVWEVIDV